MCSACKDHQHQSDKLDPSVNTESDRINENTSSAASDEILTACSRPDTPGKKKCRAYTPFKQTSQAEDSHLIACIVGQAGCKNNHYTPVLHTGKPTQ